MNPTIPLHLFPPAAALLQSQGSSLSLWGFFPQDQEPPYLYINAYFTVTAKYPYRCTQTCCSGYCLLYTENGQGQIVIGTGKEGNSPTALAQQHLFFWPCSQGFSLRSVSSHWNHSFLFLGGREADYFYQLFSRHGRRPWPVPANSRLPALLSGLTRKDASSYCAPLQQIFLTTSLLTQAVAVCQEHAEESFCPEYLLAVRRMLDEEYSLPCSLDLLEKRFQVNKFRIAREFSQYFHQAPISYLNSRRLEAAKNLLITTNDKIHEISQKTGFGSSTLFIRSFKKEFGVTPQVYRKENSRIRL